MLQFSNKNQNEIKILKTFHGGKLECIWVSFFFLDNGASQLESDTLPKALMVAFWWAPEIRDLSVESRRGQLKIQIEKK